jgi:Protein of Unknown function (DUF2784)
MYYQFLNIFFFVFHTIFTLFNLFGWLLKRTRKIHLLTMLLTAFSWFVLGIWYGWGYCFCTDWHWDVREKLGYHDDSQSYIHFLLLHLTGINFRTQLVNQVVVVVFVVCFALSIGLNASGFLKKKHAKKTDTQSQLFR